MNINEVFPSKYLKAADIKGRPPISVVIREVVVEKISETDSKPVVYFQGKEKGIVLNKTNANMIAHTYGPETNGWIGQTILLRSEPVPFGSQIVDSIRVAVAQVATHTPNHVAQKKAEDYVADQVADHQTMSQEHSYPESSSDADFDDDIPF